MLDAFLIATCSGFIFQTAASAPDAECCHISYAKASGGREGSIMCLAVLARVGPRWFTAIPKFHLAEIKLQESEGTAILLRLLPAQDWDKLKQCIWTRKPRNFPRSHSRRLDLVVLHNSGGLRAHCSIYLPPLPDTLLLVLMWSQCLYESLCASGGREGGRVGGMGRGV